MVNCPIYDKTKEVDLDLCYTESDTNVLYVSYIISWLNSRDYLLI